MQPHVSANGVVCYRIERILMVAGRQPHRGGSVKPISVVEFTKNEVMGRWRCHTDHCTFQTMS